MNKLFTSLLAGILFLMTCGIASAQVYVNPYTRSDGTQVQGHYRSAPDGNPYNNYSYPGNTNPYTGKEATGNTDSYLSHHDDSFGNGNGLSGSSPSEQGYGLGK